MSVSVFVSNNPTPFHYQTKVIGVLDGYIYEAPVVIYGYDETSPTSMPLSILRRTFAKDSVPEKIFSIENFKCQIFCRYGNIANNFGCRFTANYTMDGKGKCIYALCRGVFQDDNSNTSNTDSFFQVADAPWHLFRFHIDSGKIDIFLIKLNQFNEGFFMPCHCIGSGDLFQYLGNNTLVLYNDFLDAFPIGSKTKLNLFQHLLTLSEDESIAKLEKFGKEYVDESDENTIVIENQPDLKFTSAPIVPIASDKWIILDDNGQMVLGNTTGGSKWKILKPTKETNEQFYKRDGLDNENYRKFYRSGNNIYFLCLKNVDGEPDEVMLYEIKVFEENGTFEAKFLGTTKAEALNATPSFIYDIFIHNGVLFYLNEGILLTAFFRPLKQEEKEVLNKH